MDKAQVSSLLHEIGLLLELTGENPFKARAYYGAARALDSLDEDLATLIQEDRLSRVAGIGQALREKISTLVRTGRLQYHEDLRSQVPPGLLAMLRVPGLGPRKVQTLHHTLGLANLEDLEKAAREQRIQSLPGFGVKTELKILAGLAWMAKHKGLHLGAVARAAASSLVEALTGMSGVTAVAIAGSLRRGKEVVRDIDLVAAAAEPIKVAEQFMHLSEVDRADAAGETRVVAGLRNGIDVDLRVVPAVEYASALLHLTGSKEHHMALRVLAGERGLKLNEYGLFRGEERLDLGTEEELYQALGLSFIPPELREDMGEIRAAAQDALPALVRPEEVRGAVHVHTSYSDGTAALAEMAGAAAALGWEYLGLADHSQSAAYAGGLRVESLRKQWAEIAAHNQGGHKPRLLAGIECDIKTDGTLDYPDEILAQFDYVVASVHSGFHLDRAAMTARIVRAMRHPLVTVLGHPTGRILLERDGYDVDLEEILVAAAEYHVALEINASPYRLDLDWRWCRKARERGIVFWVNPDAHSLLELENMPLGITVARKGWLTGAQVANTWSLERIREAWREKRGKYNP